MRTVDAFCETCEETREHIVRDDPGSCECVVCGGVQQLMVPMDDVTAETPDSP